MTLNVAASNFRSKRSKVKYHSKISTPAKYESMGTAPLNGLKTSIILGSSQ